MADSRPPLTNSSKSESSNLSSIKTKSMQIGSTLRASFKEKGRLERQNSKIAKVVEQIHEESVRYGAHEAETPWISKDGLIVWSRPRIMVCKLVDTQPFERFMGLLIVFNLAIIIYETDQDATCYPEYDGRFDDCPHSAKNQSWLTMINYLLLVVYTIEMTLRLYVWRLQYFTNRWNILDMTVVLSGWVSDFLSTSVSFGFLRIFRIMRLLRAARILISIRELYMLLNGLASSLRAIFFGSFILLAMLVLWAILLVQFVHPINSKLPYAGCERCPRGLNSVLNSCLTLFQQIVAGDSWGLISIPIIEEQPLTAFIFIAIVITVSLGVMNLILAVIVERATEARHNDIENTLKEKERERHSQKLNLAKMCSEIDHEGNGSLSFKDLRRGFDTHEEFRDLLRLMDVRTEHELQAVFQVLDADRSGELSASEFCEHLHDLRNRDTRMTIVFIKAALQDLQDTVARQTDVDEVQTETLKRHTTLLETINEKIEGMQYSVLKEESDVVVPTVSNAALGVQRRPSRLVEFDAEHNPLLSVLPPATSADSVAEEIRGLRQSVGELAVLNDGIVSRAQEQAAVLTQNVAYLSELQQSLTPTEASISAGQPTAAGQPSAGGRPASVQWPASSVLSQEQMSGLSRELLERLGDQIWQLKRNTKQRMKALLKDIEEKVNHEEAMLATNSQLLDGMGEMLGRPASGVTSKSASRPASRSVSREPTRNSDVLKPPKAIPPAPESGAFGIRLCKCTSVEPANNGSGSATGNKWVSVNARS